MNMVEVIARGAVRRAHDLPCPFCGADPPLAAKIAGKCVTTRMDACRSPRSDDSGPARSRCEPRAMRVLKARDIGHVGRASSNGPTCDSEMADAQIAWRLEQPGRGWHRPRSFPRRSQNAPLKFYVRTIFLPGRRQPERRNCVLNRRSFHTPGGANRAAGSRGHAFDDFSRGGITGIDFCQPGRAHFDNEVASEQSAQARLSGQQVADPRNRFLGSHRQFNRRDRAAPGERWSMNFLHTHELSGNSQTNCSVRQSQKQCRDGERQHAAPENSAVHQK